MEITPFTPFKLLHHGDRVRSMLAGLTVFPVSVEMDLSNVCNHGCPWCSFNGFRQDNWVHFPTDRALSLLEELRGHGVQSITFTGGGEPLVHPSAAQILRHAADLGFAFGVVTNGRRLQGDVAAAIAAHATFVRVSLDAGRPQTHQLLHATATPEFTRILANLRAFTAVAPAVTVGASFCVFDVNVDEIGAAAAEVKAAGGRYLEVRPVFPTEWRGGGFAQPLTADMVEQARASLAAAKAAHDDDGFRVIGMIQRFDQVTDTRKAYTKCQIGPLTTVINATGDVYHCCIQRGMREFSVGNILKRSFADVWMTEAHRRMQADIDVSRCPPCRYDGYNQLIADAYEANGMHKEFL